MSQSGASSFSVWPFAPLSVHQPALLYPDRTDVVFYFPEYLPGRNGMSRDIYGPGPSRRTALSGNSARGNNGKPWLINNSCGI
jgi:hypothetical protein